MVVGHFLVVKHLLGFGQGPCSFFAVSLQSQQRRYGREIILYSRQRTRHFGIEVIAQIGGVHTRIGGQPFLIQRLDQLQRLLGGETEFLVAIHLKGGQVV